MKKFILAMRELQSKPKELKCKLVWNPKGECYKNNFWLVTTTFSKSFVEKMGMEFIYEQKLISE
ncbi:MAG: hypothetical protein KBE91_01565 [Bacteroidia bacterium]|nr:hypothetical protein [Bacteroidia bacterium]